MSFIPRKNLPLSLWAEDKIRIPPPLERSYEALLQEYDVMDRALSTDRVKGVFGGPTPAETIDHFARRFGVSLCRVASIVIDPYRAFSTIPGELQVTFSDGVVALLDAPCGCGAAGLSLLATATALRQARLIPRLPVTIVITAADISETGLEVYRKAIDLIDRDLRSVGIIVTLFTERWDATRSEATSILMDHWFANSPGAEEFLAVIADFSGAGNELFQAIQRSLQHIHERLVDRLASILWVEPGEMGSAIKFLRKISGLYGTMPWFQRSGQDTLTADYFWWHPFQKRGLPCRVVVQSYKRTPE